MRTMAKVDVSPDGKHATVGGGIKQLELVQALNAAGKRTGDLPTIQTAVVGVANFQKLLVCANVSARAWCLAEATASCKDNTA